MTQTVRSAQASNYVVIVGGAGVSSITYMYMYIGTCIYMYMYMHLCQWSSWKQQHHNSSNSRVKDGGGRKREMCIESEECVLETHTSVLWA